jgi:RHS repeat-associated protein
VRVETDGTGAVTNTYGNYPYGESWYGSGTKWRVTTYETDSESSLDYANARSDVPRLGRFLTCDPLGGSISDPQSLNRYTYVLSDPINGVDPLGLDTCIFNVEFFNAANLTPTQVAQIESRINAIFSGVASPNGDTVGISFAFYGSPDTEITVYQSSSFTSASGYASLLVSPRAYIDNIPNTRSQSPGYVDTTNVGGVAAHEMAHVLGGGFFGGFGDAFGLQNGYDPNNPNIMMWDTAPDNATGDAWLHSDNPLWSFTPQQIASLYNDCKKKHPSASGGGGGFNGWNTPGGGGGSGAVCYIDVSYIPNCSQGDCTYKRVVSTMCNQ